MKTNTPKNLFYTLLLSVFFIGISINGYGQCGAEAITVTPWCEGGFAKWDFTSPTPNAQYTWYNYVVGTPGYDASGRLVKDGMTSIAPIDSTALATYYSQFRVTTAGISPSTSVNFTYQKRVQYKNINPYSGAPTYTVGLAGSTFTMDFNAAFTNAQGLRFNYVTVPVQLNTIGQQYKIQVTFAAPNAGGSSVYTFSTVGAQNIGGNNYLVKIPVNYTITTPGVQKMIINTNPAGGTGVPVDRLLFASTQAPAFSAVGNPISIPANSASPGSGGFSQIYDWDYSITCNVQNAGPSSKQTNAALCCIPPASLNFLSLTSDKSSIVNGGTVTALLSAGGGSAGNYFAWYLNGVKQGFSGIGVMTHSTNLAGVWEVREVRNQSDEFNPSCTSNASVTITDKKVFLTNTGSPVGPTFCIGDKWTFTGTGSSSLVWSSGSGSLSPTTGSSTTYTATSIGSSDIVTLTGTVPTNDKVVDGNFTLYNDGNPLANGASSQFSPITGNPANSDGKYNFGTSSLGGGWGNGDWSYNGSRTGVVAGNPGKFMLVNATSNPTDPNYKTLVWGKSVTVQPGQAYNFSFDMTSISYMVSSDPAINNYGATTPGAGFPYLDVLLDVYINGVKVGQATTDFANNGGLNAIGKWKNYSYPWTASASTSQAVLELRFVSPFANNGRGYDFGLDNILFAGSETQTDTYNIGQIKDCSTISATASNCVNDSYSNLKAVLTGGLIFDHWEKTSNPTVSVGITNPLLVSSLTATEYEAFAILTLGNILDNGDFAAAGNTGFISGAPYFTYSAPTAGFNGTNVFTISANTFAMNSSAWNTLPPAPGSTDLQVFTADAKGVSNSGTTPGKPIVGWTFTAVAGQTYFFSGWAANNHVDFNATSSASTATKTSGSAHIGVYVTSGVVSNTSYLTNTSVASLKLPNNQNWNNLTGTWTATISGTYTIYAVDLNGKDQGSNDFVLDNFSLRPSTGIIKSAKATTPVCNPCLLNIPTVATSTFCGNTGTVKLTPAATDPYPTTVAFDWYNTAGPTGGTKLGTSVGSASISIDVSTAASSGANKIVYYQKTVKGGGTVGAKPACVPNDADNADKYTQQYVVYKDIDLTSITFLAINTQGGGLPFGGTYNLTTSSTNAGGSYTNVSGASVTVPFTVANLNQYVPVTITLATPLRLTGSVAGTVYYFGLSSNYKVASLKGCAGLPSTDDIPAETIVDITKSYDYGSNPTTSNFGPIYDVKFTMPAYPCPRTPVVLTPNCPCSKPSAVTITTPATTPISICEGTAQTLTGSATVTAAPLNTSFTYSWIKTAGIGSGVKVAPTAVTIPLNAATPMPSYTDITGLIPDAGTYVLRVEDGTAGNPSCYTEASVVITITPLPTITSSATGIICSGIAQNYDITSSAPSSYSWSRALVTGISNGAVTAQTADPITEILTNTTAAPVVVRYIITPTSTTGSCPGPAFNYDVTVNPTPTITSLATGIVCSGIAQIYDITSNVASSYSWSRAVVTGISNAVATAQISDPITETLTNTTTAPVVVRYIITPTSTTGTCLGAPFNYDVTVNPRPVINSAATGTICSGIPQNYDITSVVASTYSWSRAAVTGISNTAATAQTADPITEILTNTTTAAVVVRYIITPTSTTGTCVGAPFNYDVTVNPLPVINSAATGSVCTGAAQNYDITSVVPSGYSWSRALVTGISNAAVTAQTADPITETLTNTTTASVVVRYIITPTSTTGTCLGAPFNYDVTVNPRPTITSTTTGTTCTGVALNYLITSDIPAGYTWSRALVSGVTPATGSSSTNPITETLTSTATAVVTYVITPTSTTGSCPGTSFNYVVTISGTAVPTVAITQIPSGAICAGTSVTFKANQTNGGNPVFKWTSSVQGLLAPTNDTYVSPSGASGLVNGEIITVELTSDLGCANPKTATDSKTMTVNAVPIPSVALSANKSTLCPGDNILYTAVPTQGGSNPAYVWKNNGAVIGGQTTATYSTTGTALGTPNSITVEMGSNATCAPTAPAVSSPVVVTVNPVLVPTVGISAATTPATAPTTICTNGSVTFTAAPTNEGTTPSYEWFINNVSKQVSSSTTFTTTELTASSNVIKVVLTSNALCVSPATAQSSMSIIVNPGITAGTIGSAQSVCYNGIAATLTELTASSAATPTYTWEEATLAAPSAFGPVTGGTPSNGGKDFTPPALTSGMYYRRVVMDASAPAPCNISRSNSVLITVRPILVAGVIGANEKICSGAVPAIMTETTAPTGGTGTYTYQWESDAAVIGTFAPIGAVAMNSSYTSGAITRITQFRRVETSGTCGNVTSNVVTKDISAPEDYTVSINDPGVTCTGTGSSMTFTATAIASTPVTGTLSYEWFMNSTSVGTGSTYVYSPVVIGDDNKVVKVVVKTTNGCSTAPWTSNLVILDIVDASTPTVTIKTINNPNCKGLLSTFTLTSTGGGGSPTYQWYVVSAVTGTTKAVGTGGTTYSTSTLEDGDQVYAELTSSLPCLIGTNPFKSIEIIMDIKPIPTPSITQGDQTVCSPDGFTFNGNVTPGNSYEWRQVPGNVVVGTNAIYTATQSGTYMLYEDNGTCNSTSSPVTLTIIQTPIANAGADVYMKEGDVGNLNGSGGAVYSWSPSTYLNDATVSSPSFPAMQTITYTLTVSAPSNPLCFTTDDVTIFVVKPVKVPNVITVNGDGSNDDWEIENIEGYPNVIIEIYNRWGNLVWKTEGYPKNWDGTNFRNGQVLPDGTYFYIIKLQSQIYDEPLTGWVQIVK